MKQSNLTTKIFLDSGDPKETAAALDLLGFLDGQTTNPSLIAKNPTAQARLAAGQFFTRDEIDEFYKSVVGEISSLIPNGSVSIEVYADRETTAEEMLIQARQMNPWIPNAHIKFPTNAAGLEAAEQAVKEGMRVNMTLVFTSAQAAAVHAATVGAKKGAVFLSPFVGRLDDTGVNGMDLIKNILSMYRKQESPVEVLTASVRSLDHFLYALQLKSDIITAPLSILKEWRELGMPMPDSSFVYQKSSLANIPYEHIVVEPPPAGGWRSFDPHHDLLTAGIDRFAKDWNALTG